MDGPFVLVLTVGGLLSFFPFWMFCRKVVRLGFFLIALTIGATVASATMYILEGKVDLAQVAFAAITFAWLWTSIRAKVARFITLAALLAFSSVASKIDWLHTLNSDEAKMSAQKTTQNEPDSRSAPRTKAANP